MSEPLQPRRFLTPEEKQVFGARCVTLASSDFSTQQTEGNCSKFARKVTAPTEKPPTSFVMFNFANEVSEWDQKRSFV